MRIRLSARHPVNKAHYRSLAMALAGRSLPGKMRETFISISTHNGLMRMGMSYGRKTAFLFALRRKTRIARRLSVTALGAIITWHDLRSGISNSDIYAQRIDGDGNVQWTKTVYPSALKSTRRIALALQRMAQGAYYYLAGFSH